MIVAILHRYSLPNITLKLAKESANKTRGNLFNWKITDQVG